MIDFEGGGPAEEIRRRARGRASRSPITAQSSASEASEALRPRRRRPGKPGTTIGDDGPAPSLQIRNSFEDDLPAIVSMQFFWEPARRGQARTPGPAIA